MFKKQILYFLITTISIILIRISTLAKMINKNQEGEKIKHFKALLTSINSFHKEKDIY